MHHLKLIKDGTIEDFMQSDQSKFPCICCYSKAHPNYSIQRTPTFTKSKPPKPTLSFTIENMGPALPGYTGDEHGAFQFEEGMTWSEWCDSEYNTLGWYIFILDNEDIYRTFVVHNYGDYVVYGGSTVRSTDIILNDEYGYYA
jgi:hypothetical protein